MRSLENSLTLGVAEIQKLSDRVMRLENTCDATATTPNQSFQTSYKENSWSQDSPSTNLTIQHPVYPTQYAIKSNLRFHQPPFSRTVHFQVSRRSHCTTSCFCSCHQRQTFRSSALVERIFGSLFVGYIGVPSLFQRCNDRNCSSQSPKAAKLNYSFPRWFWHRAILIGVSYTSCDGPEFLLRVPRLRSRYSEWFGLACSGDVRLMQKKLESGQASGKRFGSKYMITYNPGSSIKPFVSF